MPTKDAGVRLSASEREYLSSSAWLSGHLLQILRSSPARSDGQVDLAVSRDVLEQFREAFTNRLAMVGFDPKYAPTDEGRRLESLIDRFFKTPDP